MKKEILNQIWESINYDSIEYLDKEFENIATQLLEFLIIALLESTEADIGIFRDGDVEGSEITYDFYDFDKELSLRCVRGKTFAVFFSIYDSEGELKDYRYALDSTEEKIIPPGLINLMKEVFAKKEATVFKIEGLRN